MEEELFDIRQFEGEIRGLEARIQNHQNRDRLIVCYGSSSLRLWESISEDLQPLNVLNLGFGGSSFSWCIYYFDRLFSKLDPAHIIIYVGDNDLGRGVPPEKVLKKFKMLSGMIRNSFPDAPMDFISIKPSPARTHFLPEIRLTNDLIREELLTIHKADMINIFDAMLDEYGVARRELYQEDQLHLNEEGYRIWKSVLRKHLGI